MPAMMQQGKISPEGAQALTRHLIDKGVKGVYVGGSSGECIYQQRRRAQDAAGERYERGRRQDHRHRPCRPATIPPTAQELAAHAESVGVDAIASIPPIYFHLPEYAIAKYWNDMSAAAPNTDFVIYNIPQLAGTGLDHDPAAGDAQEPQRRRRQEQLHAHPGHPDVQGCRHRRPGRGQLRGLQRAG